MDNLQDLQDRQIDLEWARINAHSHFILYEIDRELKQIKSKIEDILLYNEVANEK